MILAAIPFMYCDASARVAAIRKPADATHAGAGSITLADGASFEIDKAEAGAPPSDGDRFIAAVRRTDRVQLCYGPPERFADAGPRARMAIAGIVRTGDYVFTLAYPAKRTAAASAPMNRRFPVALAPAIAALAGATFPVLLPSIFDGKVLGRNVFVSATHAPDRYRVRFDYAPACNGANVCSAGSFSGFGPKAIARGQVTNPPDGELSLSSKLDPRERTVRLTDGSKAYYSQAPSGASDGGNSSLRWSQGGVLYAIESRISTETKLVATANSAIANGPLSRESQ